ncbi:MAG: hypothetical protein ACLFP4_13105 [Spirochaetales bacterium]
MSNQQLLAVDTLQATATRVLNEVARAFDMSDKEREQFAGAKIARLIAVLPFAADARHAERTAMHHLSTYVLSVRDTRHAFYATPEDDVDVFARLAPINQFDGGDAATIKKGMAYLALNMVNDYARDVEIDRTLGKHNPIATGAWNLDDIRGELERIIETTDAPALDEMNFDDVETMTFWTWW